MNVIKLYNINASRVIEIVHELKGIGLLQGTDFDFAFTQNRWDDMIGEIPKNTTFTFYTEKWASWFALKYSS